VTHSAGARELEAPKYNCEALIMGGLGQSSQRGREAESLIKGSGGFPWSEGQGTKPPEAATLLVSGRSMKAENLPTFEKI